MKAMHYPLGTLSRPGGVELFLATTYAVAFEDPGIAKNVRAALASQFTTREAVVRQFLPVDQLRRQSGLFTPGLDPAIDRFVGKVVMETDFTALEMMLKAQLAQEIRDGKL